MSSSADGAALLVVGLSRETAPVQVRERASLSAPGARRVLDMLGRSGVVREAVALSTCNRTEVYAVVGAGEADAAAAVIRETVSGETSISCEELRQLGYVRSEVEATEHLFGVIAGMDSTVLGEPEIVAQVRAAVAVAREAGTVSGLLEGLFHHGLAAGRRVRSTTAITRGATSVASVAVDIADELSDGVNGRRALVVGAGKIARAVARGLAAEGAGGLAVANRSAERACAMADEVGARAVSLDDLAGELVFADIVVCATGAPTPVVSRRMLGTASRARPGHLVVLDLAVPRDVEPASRDLPRVTLRDIDDVQDIAAANRDGRRRALPQAWSIVREETERFGQWRSGLEGERLVGELRRRTERIRQGEIDRVLNSSPELGAAERERLDAITRSLVTKLLHEPSHRLRAAGATPEGQSLLRALAELLAVPEPPRAIMTQPHTAGGRRWQPTRSHPPQPSCSSSIGAGGSPLSTRR